jgi:hypothetical protein
MAEIFNRCVVDVAGITVFMAYQWHQNLRKSLHALEPVAIMRVATRVSCCKLYELYNLERSTRSMWNVKKGSGLEKADCW